MKASTSRHRGSSNGVGGGGGAGGGGGGVDFALLGRASLSSSSSSSSYPVLPSLALAASHPTASSKLSELEFAASPPLVRRNRIDLFGVADLTFSRKDWRTAVVEEEEGIAPLPAHFSSSSSRSPSTRTTSTTLASRSASLSPLPVPGSRRHLDLNPKMAAEPNKERRKSVASTAGGGGGGGGYVKPQEERRRGSGMDFYLLKRKPRSPPKTSQQQQQQQQQQQVKKAEVAGGAGGGGGVAAGHQRALSFAADDVFDFCLPLSLPHHQQQQQPVEGSSSVQQAKEELSEVVFEQFFGEKAALSMQQKYREACHDLVSGPRRRGGSGSREKEEEEEGRVAEGEEEEEGGGGEDSPRTVFYREIVAKNLPPLPLLLRKESHPLGLHLGHLGVGDARMSPVVTVLDRLPALQSIDLRDNRLTDLTLLPLAQKLPALRHLTYLDLSFNKIDDSARAITTFLRHPTCSLRTLLLHGADVDDEECRHIATALAENQSIRTLGLAKNLIGQAELLNVVHPDLITGGEALGEMLQVNRTLTKLDLSWNSIRLDSAIALAVALEKNNSLQTLLLAYNAFGDMPSQFLGRALKSNKGLTELDIECNSITPKAATVLANAISFNETLIKLNINGNTLGRIGAQALVAAIQRSSTESRRLQVSFINCDCTRDDEKVFSAANPQGVWRLDLREPYGQMVATECFYLANFKAGCRIVKLVYNGQVIPLERAYVLSEEEQQGEEGKMKKFKLEEFYRNSRLAANELLAGNFPEASGHLMNLLKPFGFSMEEETRQIVLRKAKDLWTMKAKREGRDDLQETFLYEIFFALFVINDTDMSGTMEVDEFVETLASLGKKDFDREAVKRLMNEYDRDESGSIDANEFGNIMLNEFCRTEMPRGEVVEAATGQPWAIPAAGSCLIQLAYQCDAPTLFDIGADHGIDNIIQSIRQAKTDDQREILFQNTTSSPYFFLSCEQAQLLFEEMQGLNRLPLDLMANILPQIATEEQAIKFIDTNLNELGKLALRVKVGTLYCTYVGLFTGHYAIDMSQAAQRNGGRRLGAICVTEGKRCRQGGVLSSQKGNQSNFRNEKLGITPVEVTGKWFTSFNSSASSGSGGGAAGGNKVLHCDYVSTTKPRKSTLAMTDARFERLVHDQLHLEEIRAVWNRLQEKESEFLRQRAELMASAARVNPFLFNRQDSPPATASPPSASSNNSPRSIRASVAMPTSSSSSSVSVAAISRKVSAAMDPAASAPSSASPSFSARVASPPTSSTSTSQSFLAGGHHGRHGAAAMESSQLATSGGYVVNLEDFPELAMQSPLTMTAVREAYMEYVDTCHHYFDIYPEERMRDVSRLNYSASERPPTPEDMRSGPAPSRNSISAIFPLAYRRILELQILMPTLFISVNQLAKLMEYFPPNEGYLRVMLLQSVFSHLVDLENLCVIIDQVFTLSERNEAFHRLGIMNLLDPMKPDRTYRLDLRRFDHREWVKILVSLAIAEPGDNWEGVEYRWSKYDDPVPGWFLPASWTQEDDGGNNGGPRAFGWLRVTYRSHGNGCVPVLAVRKFLRKRTLAGMKRII